MVLLKNRFLFLIIACTTLSLQSQAQRRIELLKIDRPKPRPQVYFYKSESKSESPSHPTSVRRLPAEGKSSMSDPSAFLPDDMDSAVPSATMAKSQTVRVLTKEGESLKSDIKTELGEGHGETVDEARKNALVDVLQKVVGVYVDSEFRMSNEKIIKDEIITHSSGFVESYKVLDEGDSDDGCGKFVTIRARVKVRDFVNRMKKLAPSQRVAVDGALLGSALENQFNAEALLRKELDGLDPILDLMEISLVADSRPSIISTTDDTVTMRYVYQIKYSSEKYYKQFVPRFSRVLDQIAEGKARLKNVPLKAEKKMIHPRLSRWNEEEGVAFTVYEYKPKSKIEERADNTISVVRSVSRSGAMSISEWRLSKHLYDVWKSFRGNHFANRYGFGKNRSSIFVTLSLLDGSNELLSCGDHIIKEALLPYESDSWEELASFVPFVVDESGRMNYRNRYIGAVDVCIAKEDVSRIKSVEIKLRKSKER